VTGRLVPYEPYFYPLDAIHGWNRLYGARGFAQYQVAFPMDTSEAGLTEVLERLSQASRASFLAVLKRFGPGTPGPLSFPQEGYTLALDLPMSDSLPAFIRDLDQLALAHRGRVYLAKDALVAPEVFAAMYPRLEEFRTLQRRLDPEGRMGSSMARRLGIVR
jgi:decaprenylphospho-beta-D-ribofuranose 2-oxidase